VAAHGFRRGFPGALAKGVFFSPPAIGGVVLARVHIARERCGEPLGELLETLTSGRIGLIRGLAGRGAEI
jgi:hypothetical protein